VATARKKTPNKRTAKKVRKSRRASPAIAAKKPARPGRRAVKKAAKKAGKTAKKAARKPAAKPPKKTKASKSGSTPRQTKIAGKTVKRSASGSKAKAATAAAAVQPRGNRYYITTAIAYPNGMPHIGHAYEAIATDALARFQRLDGRDVFFLTGTDEHGLKMIQTAQGEGMTPSELADRNAARFKEMDQRLNVSFDRFIRTSEPAHHRSVQVIWNRMQQNGDIYIDTYSGWYSVREEAYYAEE
jgi:methionyl-tRNA synthetase